VNVTRDTTTNPPVREIVADGNAFSVYQIGGSGAKTNKPAINYVRGRRITVAFDSGQVNTVTVTDSATGVYLDPSDSTQDSTAAAARRRTQAPANRAPRAGSVIPGRRPSGSGTRNESRAALLDDRTRRRP